METHHEFELTVLCHSVLQVLSLERIPPKYQFCRP